MVIEPENVCKKTKVNVYVPVRAKSTFHPTRTYVLVSMNHLKEELKSFHLLLILFF